MWKCHQRIKKTITCISIYIILDYLYVFHANKLQYRFYFIILINRENLPGPEDARIFFYIFFQRKRGITINFKEVF